MKRNKKEKLLYNPMQLTEELKKLGESYDKKTTGLYYFAVLMLSIAFGFFLELKPVFILLTALVYFLFVPQLMYNRKKHAYELRRFNDVNSYMHQMIQSFTRTKHIPTSLRETRSTFTKGKMRTILDNAVDSIDSGGKDVRAAEDSAFKSIEEMYGCEKLRTLHDFLLKAERRGGSCTAEFGLLEKGRALWQGAVMDYHRKLEEQRKVGSILYLLVMLVNIFLMNYLKKNDMNIINEYLTQVVNTVMLIAFIVFFVFLDKRLNTSLLKDARVMSQEEADELYTYMQGFDSKKERKKYIGISVLSVIGAVLFVVWKPSFANLFIGIAIIGIGFNIPRIILMVTVRNLKKEIEKEFPKWLFDMLLLLQRESVEGAIFQSVEKAPPVLKGELQRISSSLRDNPQNADTYMSFLADFNLPNVENTMRTLYSLSVGTGGEKLEIMSVIIESNISLLAKAERDSIEDKASFSSMVESIPELICAAAVMGYTVVLISVVLRQIASML